MAVSVRFESGILDRMSRDYGPYDVVQMTRGLLHGEKDGEAYAIGRLTQEDSWLCYFDEHVYRNVVID